MLRVHNHVNMLDKSGAVHVMNVRGLGTVGEMMLMRAMGRFVDVSVPFMRDIVGQLRVDSELPRLHVAGTDDNG